MDFAPDPVPQWFVLVASLAGIIVGWGLTEISTVVRSKRERQAAAHAANAARAFAVLGAWQVIVDSSAMLAIQKDLASTGHTDGQWQVEGMAEDLNTSQARMRELAIEVEVLGPSWMREKVLEVVDKLSDLNRNLLELDKPSYTVAKGTAFRDKIEEMLRDRESLIDLARRNLTTS